LLLLLLLLWVFAVLRCENEKMHYKINFAPDLSLV